MCNEERGTALRSDGRCCAKGELSSEVSESVLGLGSKCDCAGIQISRGPELVDRSGKKPVGCSPKDPGPDIDKAGTVLAAFCIESEDAISAVPRTDPRNVDMYRVTIARSRPSRVSASTESRVEEKMFRHRRHAMRRLLR